MKLPQLSLLTLLTSLFCWQLVAAAQSKGQPNFVVFISDDHSAMDSGPYGATDIRTPEMNNLALSGMKFNNVFVASPACGPSRTALLTGLWPARNGAEPNHRPKRPEVASLPPLLRELGYEVAAIGKVAHSNYAKDHGFDFIDGPNQGIVDTELVASFLSNRDKSKPLCLFVGTRHPHVPWGEITDYDPAAVKIPPMHVDTAITRQMRAKYYSDITRSDRLLGEVRQLVRDKLNNNTLFVYTADHGSQWPFGKWNLYDAGLRVPLLIAWPGHLSPATTSDAMLSWPDLLPTFIELAGGKAPDAIDGKSFAGVLLGKTSEHRQQVFATHSGDGDFNVYPIRSLRTNAWKYILNLHPEFQHHTHISRSSGPSGLEYWKSWEEAAKNDPAAAALIKRLVERSAEELYDLTADPLEQHNLAADPKYSDRLTAMRNELVAWMRDQGDQRTVFGTPLLIGQEPTLITPGAKKK